ncbi:sec-independent protein translocase protein TatA [Glaciihabitans tibetensis]|uniref:Sec-independent protein translocase protein TatA n=1 Tax=Glaciihabitans tibetensis TaxID=1266600 RepID=A0A2T0VK20_9MICO|nr:twin-arginine translocase TatA/TatE family subunit [Glaciihabitans tibetensis]PRY70544.1 sec-independent protein translocase protein TatA [Glaciihabitans tibetensis]
MLSGFTGWHLLIILIVVLLLFGGTKLPALARGLGESLRIFKSEIKKDDAAAPSEAAPNVTAPGAAVPDPGAPVVRPSDSPDGPQFPSKP